MPETRPPEGAPRLGPQEGPGLLPRPHRRRPNGTEEQGRCLEHLRRKEAEAVEKRGSGLTQREVEDLTRLFYAPGHRAAMNRLPAVVWEEVERDLSEDEEAA